MGLREWHKREHKISRPGSTPCLEKRDRHWHVGQVSRLSSAACGGLGLQLDAHLCFSKHETPHVTLVNQRRLAHVAELEKSRIQDAMWVPAPAAVSSAHSQTWATRKLCLMSLQSGLLLEEDSAGMLQS